MINSVSGIMLISLKCLQNMSNICNIYTEQYINLVQVTSSAKIDGFSDVSLSFDTSDSLIQFDTKAYILNF